MELRKSFLEKISVAIRCCICLDDYNDPLFCPFCGQGACRMCFWSYFDNGVKGEMPCPLCKQKITFGYLVKVPLANDIKQILEDQKKKQEKLKAEGIHQNNIEESLINPNNSVSIKDSFNGKPKREIPCGLPPFESSFKISIIQCLFYCQSLTKYFLSGRFEDSLFKEATLSKSYCNLIKSLYFLTDVNNDKDTENIETALNLFFKTVSSLKNWFSSDDSEENGKSFLNFILDKIGQEIMIITEDKKNPSNKESKIIFSDYSNEQKMLVNFARQYKWVKNRVIIDRFSLVFESIKKCKKCQVEQFSFHFRNMIVIPFEKIIKNLLQEKAKEDEVKYKTEYMVGNLVNTYNLSLNDCINFINTKEINSQQSFYCSNCKQSSFYSEINKIFTTGNFLIIYLDKKVGDKYNLFFNENLVINIYTDKNKSSPINFDLFALVVREEEKDYAYCKSFEDNIWYKFDELNVQQTSFNNDISLKKPYVFFYQKRK